MKISVWDTYVKRADDTIMHFDILVPSTLIDEEVIFNFGKEYLASKTFKTHSLTSEECRFCHIEHATEDIINTISKRGYAIIEIENCDSFN